MNDQTLSLPLTDVRKLLGSASGDTALLYLYLHAGGDLEQGAKELRLSTQRLDCALASLRQLGLWQVEKEARIFAPQAPVYTERDLANKMESGHDFELLLGEAQRRLGRILSTEEMKILLSLTDYLGLPTEVIGLLITYCIQQARSRGDARTASIRTIEKEAYYWADNHIDTVEEAAFYTQNQAEKRTHAHRIQKLLQLDGRRLSAGESRYIASWLDMGFGDEEILHAYEKTCLNTGSMKWPYCNSILKSWHGKGLVRLADILTGDGRSSTPYKSAPPTGSAGSGELGQLERDAVAKMLQLS